MGVLPYCESSALGIARTASNQFGLAFELARRSSDGGHKLSFASNSGRGELPLAAVGTNHVEHEENYRQVADEHGRTQ